MPSAQQLRDANAALSAEISAREAAETELRAAKLQVERLLEQAQRRATDTAVILQRFFEEAPMGMALVESRGTVVRTNESMEAMVAGELLGSAEQRQLPRDAEMAFLEVRQGAPRRDVEVAFGDVPRRRVARCSFFPIKTKSESNLFGWIAQDVTQEIAATQEKSDALESLAEANRRAREESAQFQALADNIAQLAWMTDVHGWIYWYNLRWFEYTGTDLGQMQGWGWKSVHHPDHVQRVEEKFRSHIASGEAWEDTFPLRGADGAFRWFLSRAFPMRDADGRIVRWFGTNTDIDDQVLAQQRLRETDKRKDEFIAALAHELRNPLAPVRNAAEILSRVNHDDPRSRRATGILLRQVSHMARLVDDLLDVARVNAGKLEIRPQPCDLAHVARTVCHDYASTLEASGNHLVLQLDDPLPVFADPVRLAQAIGNFLQNAARFAHGTPVEVTATIEGTEAVVQVRDFGAGIPSDLLPRLFEPFTQGPQDLSRSRGGLGLGLALTKGIALLHGGRVTAANHAGGGAVFRLTLPLSTG
jgi:PAS domain S-box-containing protein